VTSSVTETAFGPIPIRRVAWRPCLRIVPSRFLPIHLFERVADPEDWDALIAIESLTNDRLRDERGEIQLVAPEDRVAGPGASYIMAAFTHPAPDGGRFTDGTFGAYYAAKARTTAMAETRHHRERFMRATAEPPMELDMRVLEADLDGDLHDVRGMGASLPTVYSPDDYAPSRSLARALRASGSRGIAFDSVRDSGGECAAVLRPPVLSRCREAEHLCYVWDGERIRYVYEKRFPT
jgi:hypothetical protein